MAYPVYYPVENDTLPILFDTYSGSTGASATMTGLAVTDIEIYKDGGTTQRASDAGYTLLDTDGIDIDGITGIHGFSIDLSDNTDAGFYEVGPWYHVVVSTITVDSQTVSFVACAFRIVSATRGLAGTALPAVAAGGEGGIPTDSTGKTAFNDPSAATIADAVWDETYTGHLDSGKAGKQLWEQMDGITGVVTNIETDTNELQVDWTNGGRLDLIVDAILDDTGSAGVVVASGSKTGYSLTATTGLGNQTANLTGNLSGSVGSVTGAVGSVTGAVGSVTGNVGGNVAGSVASVAGNVSGSVGSIATDGIAAASVSAAAVTKVQAGLALDATVAKAATVALDATVAKEATVAALNDLSAAQVNAEVVDALNVDTYTEPGQGAPTATPTIRGMLHYLYKAWRNKTTQTATTQTIYDDAGTTADHAATVSDDGSTLTRGEMGTGA